MFERLNVAFYAISLIALSATAATADTIAITNAHIYTMGPPGELINGTLVIRGDKIVSVGRGATIPSGAKLIDAKGGIVTPGLIVTNTVLGLLEVSSVRSTNDTSTHSSVLSAAFDVQYGLNSDSTLLPVARLGGVTSAVAMPEADGIVRDHDRMFSGQAAMISLGQSGNILLKSKVGMILELGEAGAGHVGGARGAEIVELLAVFNFVRAYQRNKSSYSPEAAHDLGLSFPDVESLVPVVLGKMPLIVVAHRAADIRVILEIARQQKIKIILSDAEEAWRVADEIAAARVPVLLNVLSDLPTSFEKLNASMENAARLHAAGVKIAISGTDSGHMVREVRYNAGIAVAHGLPYGAALEAITLGPARIFGVDKIVGSLQPGKEADVVLWNGDPFEPSTQPVAIFIRGAAQPLTSRPFELGERYAARFPKN